jgi:hypothetical protein
LSELETYIGCSFLEEEEEEEGFGKDNREISLIGYVFLSHDRIKKPPVPTKRDTISKIEVN